MPRGVFRTFNRDNRPLSDYLRQRVVNPLVRRIESLPLEELRVEDDNLVIRLVASEHIQPPRLLGQERAGQREGEYRPTREAGTKLPTTRHYVAIQVEGDIELLEYWPDHMDHGLIPVDARFGDWVVPNRGEAVEYEEEIRRYEALLAQDRWFINHRDESDSRALYTWIDLSAEDEEQVERGERDLSDEVIQSLSQIEPIVAAIDTQTRVFFERELPLIVADAVERRRRQSSAREAVLHSLVWPVGWKYPEPTLEEADSEGDSSEIHQRADDTDEMRELHVEHRSRLSDATFADVMRTMRIWADAVERHPLPYSDMVEDRLSDLLAAALNASLPGAQREVYSRGGKSDLYIRADAVATGAGPAKVFICECKWWNGAVKAVDALDQLFGYLEAKDTAAILAFFVPLSSPAIARTEGNAALAGRPDYAGAAEAAVEGWPVFRFGVAGRAVEVCVAYVDLPR